MFSAHSLLSEIIINTIGDKNGSIFIFKVFVFFCFFGHFWEFLGIFGTFGIFWVFCGGSWVLEVLVSYEITRGTILVVGRVNNWV